MPAVTRLGVEIKAKHILILESLPLNPVLHLGYKDLATATQILPWPRSLEKSDLFSAAGSVSLPFIQADGCACLTSLARICRRVPF